MTLFLLLSVDDLYGFLFKYNLKKKNLILVKLPYPVDHNEPLYDTYMWSTVGVAAEVLTVFLQQSYTIG